MKSLIPQSETNQKDIKVDIDNLYSRLSILQNELNVLSNAAKAEPSVDKVPILQQLYALGSWNYQSVLRSGKVVPTHQPTNREQQFYFYHTGTDYRLYVNMDGDWKYASLT